MSNKHQRRVARENALALLYSCDITDMGIIEAIEEGAYPDEEFVLSSYAERLLRGVAERLDEIDAQLAATSENWALDRMPIIDRAILRLATFEMLHIDEVPVSVAISEAVELAKQFGGEDESSRFVNGVLGRIARSIEGQSGVEATDEVICEVATETMRETAVEPACDIKPAQEVEA